MGVKRKIGEHGHEPLEFYVTPLFEDTPPLNAAPSSLSRSQGPRAYVDLLPSDQDALSRPPVDEKRPVCAVATDCHATPTFGAAVRPVEKQKSAEFTFAFPDKRKIFLADEMSERFRDR